MFLPNSYLKEKIWSTIDIECIEDANFGIKLKHKINIDYACLVDEWLSITNHKGCAFVLGSFAKKYPHIIKKLSNLDIDIASHGLNHTLVYKMSFKKWLKEIKDSKKIIEDITGKEVKGYRSPSWSLPFEKKYYEALVTTGFRFSSSYFPFKTYMYGNEIDKKNPFEIYTQSGNITEIPIPKKIIPYSGGFYTRVLPYRIISYLSANLIKNGIKPVFYVHPYELTDQNLFLFFSKNIQKDMAFFMSFIQFKNTKHKIQKILEQNV